ncbi:hypothetical protein NESM_000092200 [Novymonas esmeraldas]|uniref:Uncharacterized protein n=1 Tax=Novymonas esmeraldas TaxID=1808958 RepID=A0AAW0F4M4_9TRYP
MSSADIEAHSQEEHEASVPLEENGAAEESPVAAVAPEEPANGDAAAEGEHEGAAADEDLSDPRIFKMAAREVDECYMSVIRGLSAFGREDEDVCRNAVDICKDIIAMEQSLFSELPSYVAQYISSQRGGTDAYNKTIAAHETIPTADGPPRDWEERRAYVDPGVPLMLPYDAERFKAEQKGQTPAEGTYHNLFFGDGSQVSFPAPDDNKRKQLQDEQKKHPHLPYHGPYKFEPQQKKTMRVAADFVPSCAEVDNPRAAPPKRPATKAKAKKAKKSAAAQ